jgi:hypothetical protein
MVSSDLKSFIVGRNRRHLLEVYSLQRELQ